MSAGNSVYVTSHEEFFLGDESQMLVLTELETVLKTSSNEKFNANVKIMAIVINSYQSEVNSLEGCQYTLNSLSPILNLAKTVTSILIIFTSFEDFS